MPTTYRLVFVCSLATLAFEVLLLRIFSIRLSYHYASLIISLSMLGLVIGSLLIFFLQKTPPHSKWPSSLPLQWVSAALVFSYPSIFILLSVVPLDHVRMLWENIQIVYLVLFILLCTIPFFLYGAFISLALSVGGDKVNRVYAADLLGGAAGLFLIVILMNYLRTEYVLLIVTAAAGSVIMSAMKSVFMRILLGTLLFALSLPIGLNVTPLTMSPYKGLMQALRDDGARHVSTIYSSHSRLDLFEHPRMKFAPGLSLGHTDPVPKGLGIALDGDITGVIMDETNVAHLTFLGNIPSALPYLLANPKDVIVVGARNNIYFLQPKYFGALRVYGTEDDASVLAFLRKQGKDYGSFPLPIFQGLARNLLRQMPHRADLIVLSKTSFFPSGSFGLYEDYNLTVDAIESYLKALGNGGLLFVQMFLLPPPRLELRLAQNVRSALGRMGIHETGNHLLIYRSWDTINFLIKGDGFSAADFSTVRHFLSSRQFDLLYPPVPGQERFISGFNYEDLFHHILQVNPSINFESSYPFDIRETTDERPFFYYFLKLATVGEVFGLSGRKWSYFLHEGMFMPFVLLFLVLIALFIFGFTFLLSRGWKLEFLACSQQMATRSLIYFVLIGFAFMFIEVFFIHRLILPFGSPVTAFSLTLVTVLLAAGAGSCTVSWVNGRKLLWVMLLAPVFCILSYFFFDLFRTTRGAALFMLPLGAVMGFFFPLGLRLLVGERPGGTPLAYGANGTASIIAPSLASLLAVSYGCNILLILAALCYALGIIIISPAVLRSYRSSQRL